jgi:hypothetical protein
MEHQRLQREAQANATPAMYVAAPAPGSTLDESKTPEKKATRKLDVFTASAPGPAKPKKPEPKAKKDTGAAPALNRSGGQVASAKPGKPAKGDKPAKKS